MKCLPLRLAFGLIHRQATLFIRRDSHINHIRHRIQPPHRNMLSINPFVLLSLLISLSVASFNQAVAQTGTLLDNYAGYSAVPIDLAVKSELGTFTSIGNTVFKPDGEGKLPAAVIVHTCGGVQNEHIRRHANELLEAGFVVLIQDSHTPRGFRTCRERPIPFAVGLMDAYTGLNHLATLPFVDAERVFLAGYSYGGFVAMLASSPRSTTTFKSQVRFRAAVAHYANCVRPSGARTLLEDLDRPLLMLFGERDTETPMATCFPLLDELLVKGQPVSWHVYPGMTHGWDKQGESANGYIFDRPAALDATRRMIEFFNKHK
ncbi:COG0412 Dienelactone hydrolase and related enzymes [Comamonadaceae bacterium]